MDGSRSGSVDEDHRGGAWRLPGEELAAQRCDEEIERPRRRRARQVEHAAARIERRRCAGALRDQPPQRRGLGGDRGAHAVATRTQAVTGGEDLLGEPVGRDHTAGGIQQEHAGGKPVEHLDGLVPPRLGGREPLVQAERARQVRHQAVDERRPPGVRTAARSGAEHPQHRHDVVVLQRDAAEDVEVSLRAEEVVVELRPDELAVVGRSALPMNTLPAGSALMCGPDAGRSA